MGASLHKLRKTISAQQSFDGLRVWDKEKIHPQDDQKDRTSHPPNPGAPRRALSHAGPQRMFYDGSSKLARVRCPG